MLKTPPESDQWFQSYEQLKIEGFSEQKRKQRSLFIFWLYLAINALDFRLIPIDRNTHEGVRVTTTDEET